MRFSVLATAAAISAQVACTIGAPAMNDSSAQSGIVVERLSVAHRTSLPECTPEREDLRAYVRDEKLATTCDGTDWRDPQGNIVAPAADDAGTPEPNAELPGSGSSGTVSR